MRQVWDVFVDKLLLNAVIVGVVGGAIVTYLNESLDVLLIAFRVRTARRSLAGGRPRRMIRAVHNLVEIARTHPARRQEMVDLVTTECYQRHFSASVPGVTPASNVEVFVAALKALLSVPRKDDNGHGLNLDLHQVALRAPASAGVYLEKMNLRDVVLWGSEFENVDLSRSTFEDADLGGARFVRCGLEDVEFKNARLAWSPLDGRPTVFEESHLARSTLDEAWILETTQPQLVVTASEVDRPRAERLGARGPAVRMQLGPDRATAGAA